MIALSLLRAHLREPPTADNALIRLYEQAAVARVERETGFSYVAEASVVEELEGSGNDSLWLANLPKAGAAFTLKEWDGTAWQTVPASDYRRSGRVLYRTGGAWKRGRLLYQASYTAGYAQSGAAEEISIAAPADIREAVLELVAAMYTERTTAAETPQRAREIIQATRRMVA